MLGCNVKKAKHSYPYNEREQLIGSLKFVDDVVQFDDADDTAPDAVNHSKKYPLADLIFANGGDRNTTNIPELKHFAEHKWIHLDLELVVQTKRISAVY